MPLTSDQRRAIWERDQGMCGICGQPVAWDDCDIDHTLPWRLGGSHAPENVRATHRRCNRGKAVQDRRAIRAARGAGLLAHDMPDDRLNMRLDARTIARLKALEDRMELKRPDLIKQAVRLLAEREGVERAGSGAPAGG